MLHASMGLTRQQQLFLIAVIGLLLTGWAVKAYRVATPPPAPGETQR